MAVPTLGRSLLSARWSPSLYRGAVKNLAAGCPQGAGRAVTRDDLVWAMECVLSRAFNGRFGGGQNVSESEAQAHLCFHGDLQGCLELAGPFAVSSCITRAMQKVSSVDISWSRLNGQQRRRRRRRLGLRHPSNLFKRTPVEFQV